MRKRITQQEEKFGRNPHAPKGSKKKKPEKIKKPKQENEIERQRRLN